MKSQHVVKKIRKLTGLSQTDFSKLSGLHRSAISYFELGIRIPLPHHVKKYIKVSDEFGVKLSMEDFY